MELLGDSIGSLRKKCGGKFSLKTTMMLADQLVTFPNKISILEFIHSETILHRDLKLENILMGIDKSYFQVHLIDFGLSKRYIDPQTEKHIPMKAGKSIMGALEYASINNHCGKELSRRDDLESLGYILAHLLLGELPWSGLASTEKPQEYEARILGMKQSFMDSPVFKDLPLEVQEFVQEVKNLGFEEEPKYIEYRRSFKKLMIKQGFQFDRVYDWVLLPVKTDVEKQIQAIDQLLDMEDDLTLEEQAELASVLKKYNEDPTVLDFHLDDIRKQNKKFDVISPNVSPETSVVPDDKNKKKEAEATGKKNKKTGGKNRDCSLI